MPFDTDQLNRAINKAYDEHGPFGIDVHVVQRAPTNQASDSSSSSSSSLVEVRDLVQKIFPGQRVFVNALSVSV